MQGAVARHPGRRLRQLRHRGRHRRPEPKVLSRARQGREQYVPRLPWAARACEGQTGRGHRFLVRRCKVDGIALHLAQYLLAGSMAPIAG